MTTLRELSEHPDYLAMKAANDRGGRQAAGEALIDMLSDHNRDLEDESISRLVQMCFLATGQEERAARVVV